MNASKQNCVPKENQKNGGRCTAATNQIQNNLKLSQNLKRGVKYARNKSNPRKPTMNKNAKYTHNSSKTDDTKLSSPESVMHEDDEIARFENRSIATETLLSTNH